MREALQNTFKLVPELEMSMIDNFLILKIVEKPADVDILRDPVLHRTSPSPLERSLHHQHWLHPGIRGGQEEDCSPLWHLLRSRRGSRLLIIIISTNIL